MSQAWPDLLTDLVARSDLNAEQTAWAMNQILAGEATPAQIAGFMVALQAKGVTADELSGLVAGMLGNAVTVDLPVEAVDIVGTGGDRANTVNVSTMASVVAAAAGAKVIKHGNRAASSACGTADCLEALGVCWICRPRVKQPCSTRWASSSCSRPCTTRRCATRPSRGANWASVPPSTSWVRSRTPPGLAPPPSALRMRAWPR